MLLEQNAVPGLTNRLLAPFVRSAAVSFEKSLKVFGHKGFVSGNPVRPEFFGPMVQTDTPPDTCRLLVVGGSQGARKINEAMTNAAPALAAIRPRLIVTHQAGPRDVDSVQKAYDAAGIEATSEIFSRAYRSGDVCLRDRPLFVRARRRSRNSAAVGRASILVPLATATDDHQHRNAEVIADAGGAEVLLQDDLQNDGSPADWRSRCRPVAPNPDGHGHQTICVPRRCARYCRTRPSVGCVVSIRIGCAGIS